MNSIYESLLSINDRYREAGEKAKSAKEVPYGMVELSKRDARARFSREWAVKSLEERQAELAIPGRVDEILDLMEGAE